MKHDFLRVARRIELHEHARQNPLCPGATDNSFDLGFSRVEPLLAILGVQDKALEVTETIVNKSAHFAAKADAPFTFIAFPAVLRYALPGR